MIAPLETIEPEASRHDECPVCGGPMPADGEPSPAYLRKLLGAGACQQLGIYELPADLRLSVVIPVYNERKTLAELVRRVREVPIPKDIVLVDDGSKDGTRDLLA